MDKMNQLKHLYARAGFGWSTAQNEETITLASAIDQLLNIPEPQPITVVTQDEYIENTGKAMKAAMMTEDAMKDKKKSFREKTDLLARLWFQEMVTTEYPLREKMALFWHGHFATRIDNPYFDQLLLQDLRRYATGKFSDLLIAVSKSPAMLQFLNNQQNKKQHPNENFAREVMELFTLGRGHYTEMDVKEAARSFTGWAYDDEGNFIFRKKQHDDGVKNFLGKTGNFNGDDILNILLEQKQTAIFVTQKMYRFLVNDEVLDNKRVQQLATYFVDQDYNIDALLKRMFTEDWFYSKSNIAAKIKSPIELLVGMQRNIPMAFEKEQTLDKLQKVLGQQLFHPPNVAGWPGGKHWIDSSSLVLRMRLPEAFMGDKDLEIHAKEQDAEMTEINKTTTVQSGKKESRFRLGNVKPTWDQWLQYWEAKPKEQLPELMAGFLLPAPLSAAQRSLVQNFADDRSREQYTKSLTLLLMSLPEYQLS